MKGPKFLATKLKNGKYSPKVKYGVRLDGENNFYDPGGLSFGEEFDTQNEAIEFAKKYWEENRAKNK